MFKQGIWIGAVASGLALCAAPAFAADDDRDSGFYLGGALGDFSADYHKPGDAEDQGLHFDRNDAERIFAGWRVNKYFSAQLDWTDFGRSQAAQNELGLAAKTDGWTPEVRGTLPLGPVELFAKVGEMFSNVTVNDSSGRLVDSSSHDPAYGVGVGFTVLKRLNINAEYERIHFADLDNADAVWLNASWRF